MDWIGLYTSLFTKQVAQNNKTHIKLDWVGLDLAKWTHVQL